MLPHVSAADARRLLLAAQGLLADPARPVSPAAVYREIERMGFVQLDTINVVERAHHHILLTRFDGYRATMLSKLLERDRKLFEHWTHDASAIPTVWFPHWRLRFDRYGAKIRRHKWWNERLGARPEETVAHVFERLEREGPLMSRDFEGEGDGKSTAWWGWKPRKAALEYLWRTGRIAIARRVHFQKVYDLTERVLGERAAVPAPPRDEHIDWACRCALDRLGVATAAELAAFLRAIEPAEALDWCKRAATSGAAVEVEVGSEDGSAPRRAFARPDWKRHARQEPADPKRLRLLSPFDPVVRDRKRLARLFAFEYRFEAFVRAPARTHGYYVLPILEGERLIGRLDPRFDRARGELVVNRVWWEPAVRETRERRRRLEEAVNILATGIGAERCSFE